MITVNSRNLNFLVFLKKARKIKIIQNHRTPLLAQPKYNIFKKRESSIGLVHANFDLSKKFVVASKQETSNSKPINSKTRNQLGFFCVSWFPRFLTRYSTIIKIRFSDRRSGLELVRLYSCTVGERSTQHKTISLQFGETSDI